MIPVNEPLLNGNEKKYLNECVDTGWISSEGPFVKKFEDDFSAISNRAYGISVCNGTAALEIAVEALGITKGDEVILPSFTIISCVSAIIKAGATPVLVDSEELTWNMNVSQIEAKITNKTKAIMLVHIYGLTVDVDPVLELATRYNLKVIEDAAEAHGQTYKGKPCGSFGDVSVFSFYPNKLITTGEGGMILTNDSIIAERLRSLRNLCFTSKRFIHQDLGWNMRMTNLQAAIGVAQLERWQESINRKREIGKLYTELLISESGLTLPVIKTSYCDNIYWVYGVILKDMNISAETIMKQLADEEIGTRPFFYPMHLQPVLKNRGLFKNEKYPIAEKLYKQGFYLPCGLAITNKQIVIVAETLKRILKNG
ncbi:MAG: DegT/DnrJ/EryC1/StrS family aminotransferase [Bacteroidota bacterium]|nr:DegT/DnrJ/EryC1/StrS family aminotransferase [Bacteroidota bacterium]